MKIFISYRRKDSAREVGRIRDRLKAAFGEQSVFRDLVDIPSGVDFRTVLERETKGCDAMLVVIGPLWAGITDDEGNKRLFKDGDWTRIEVETGLTRLQEGTVRVFPVLVLNASMPPESDLPESLRPLTNQNAISVHDDPYFDFDMERLIRDIKNSRTYHPIERLEYFEPETVYIPESSFWMGGQPGEGIPAHETPQHEVNLPAYCIGKYPVTNAQYEVFVHEAQEAAPQSKSWEGKKVREGMEEQPVTGVAWQEALAYCDWLCRKTGRKYSLPNEAQWEKACRGGGKARFPWGDEFDATRCNHGKLQLAAVDSYPAQNQHGLFDLVGNVRQWTTTLWGKKFIAPDADYAYPWRIDGRDDLNASRQIRRVIRGTSFAEDFKYLRCSTRMGQLPEDAGWAGAGISFRIAVNLS